MEGMSEHTGLISSLSLLLVQTQAERWKATALEQLTGVHLYKDISKSGHLFHGFSSGMRTGIDSQVPTPGITKPTFSATSHLMAHTFNCLIAKYRVFYPL